MKNLLMVQTHPIHRRTARLAVIVLFAALLSAVPFHAAFAQTAPALGSAESFAVLSGTAVTCTDSTIAGDVGVYPGTAVTQTNCTINGTIHAEDASAVAAYNDFLSAYDALALKQCDYILSGNLGGFTLTPGVYCFDAAATVTDRLTLDGPADGVWIFKIGTSGTGALTGTNFSVVMSGGGQASNVYWWIADAATMTTSNFQGTILAGAATTFTGGSLIGRDLSKAAVTLTGVTITGAVPFHAAFVQTAPALGSAASFAILGGPAVTCTDSILTGDVGIFSPVPSGSSVTQTNCTINGTINAGDWSAVTAYNDFLSAYNALKALPATSCDQTLTGTLAGVTLAPGVYCFDAAATVTGQLTLDGPANGVWIFKIGTSGIGALTGTNFSVVMSNGGQASNVYWWIAEAATMTTSNIQGSILAGAATTFTGGSLIGRDFAKAAVTITGATIIGCK